MHANDAVLMDNYERDIRKSVASFAEVCKCSCLEVNMGSSKVMVVESE